LTSFRCGLLQIRGKATGLLQYMLLPPLPLEQFSAHWHIENLVGATVREHRIDLLDLTRAWAHAANQVAVAPELNSPASLCACLFVARVVRLHSMLHVSPQPHVCADQRPAGALVSRAHGKFQPPVFSLSATLVCNAYSRHRPRRVHDSIECCSHRATVRLTL